MEQVYLKSPLQRLGRLIVDAKKTQKNCKRCEKKNNLETFGSWKKNPNIERARSDNFF